MINEYASWSAAFRSIIKHYIDKKDEFFGDLVIGKDNKGNDLTLKDWCSIANNSFIDPVLLDNVDTFKSIDLGGGDQKKIIEDDDQSTIQKYNYYYGVLITAGSDETRIRNLNILQPKIYPNDNNRLNALSLDIETKLTMLHIMTRHMTLLFQIIYIIELF